MSRSSVLILAGLLLILVPFAGIPSTWIAFIVPVLGIVVCITGFSVRETQVQKAVNAEMRTETPKATEPKEPEPHIHHGVSPI
jgi:hypothetical protein